MTDYVPCPVTITSPAPSPGAQALGLEPNMACGERCEVWQEASQMEFRCPRGHAFIATPADVLRG